MLKALLLAAVTANWTPPATYTTGAPIPAGTKLTFNLYAAQQVMPVKGTPYCDKSRFVHPWIAGLTAPPKVFHLPAGVYCVSLTAIAAGKESAVSWPAIVVTVAP